MIRATDDLRLDHATIARGLEALAGLAAEVRAGEPFPAAECATLLRFLREFAIGVHLHKEASIVCPAVAMHGDDSAAAAVGEALRLHEEIVELSHSLVMFWEPVIELTAAEREGFAETVDAVVARMRRLAALDEQRLFPASDTHVPPDYLLDWPLAFARIDGARTGRRVWDRRLAPLVARWRC